MAYYFVDENGRVTKKEASKKKKKNQPSYTVDLEGNVTKLEAEIDEELAPVKKTTDAKERTWFQGSDLFDDGYQFGDVLKTAFSSTRDLGQNMTKGLVGIAEKTVDAGAFIAGGVGNLLGADEFAGSMRNFVKKDLIDEEKVAKYITGNVLLEKAGLDMENDSVFGEKTDSLAESAGQLGGTVALQAIGVPWYLTTGVTSFGGEAESALKKGASYGEAAVSAAVTTAVELLTEKMFGGSGLGEKGLINTSALTKGITNKALKALAAFGVDMAAEGSEEVVSEFASTLGQQLTYEREDTIAELLNNEEAMDDYIRKVGESLFGEEARAAYGEAFIGGAVLGGGMNAGKVAGSIKNKTDYNTGLNSNEEAVFNREYESRIAEEEKGGKKLTQKQKDAIYDEVMDDLGRGRVSTDTIESVLGGETYKAFEEGVTGFDESETYKAYQEAVAEEKAIREEFETLQNMKAGEATIGQQDRYNELKARIAEFETKSKSKELRAQLEPEIQRINALKKQLQAEVAGKVQGDRLSESYRELQRSTEKFQADPAKYKDEHARKTIQNLIDGGIANNTREFHEFADMLAKWSEDKGLEFDAVDNKKLAGTRYAVQGATVNAYVTEDGKIAFNVDSGKRLNSLAGHEITHVLEGTAFYDTLAKAVKEYATKKGEWDTRLASVTELYKKYNPKADPEKELTADLVGDYIFTDKAFLETLSVKHRNIFQRLWDEIKYMAKTATAGSKEARALEKAKKAFADAYRASGKVQAKAKKENLSTPIGEQAPINTPEANSGTVSSADSIAENSEKSSGEAKNLSPEQEEFFKDSVVRDENGKLKVMYHGTSKGGHTVFDPYGAANYGLFGAGSYFTDSKEIAESYTKKGKGTSPQVYETYLNITNPIDMDAPADPAAWKAALPETDFPESGTNEDFYRAMEEYFEDMEYPRWEAAQTAMEVIEGMGYDGITHIGGGRVNADGPRHQVYIAFQPEQIKRTDNVKPTGDADIRYSISEDTDGDYLDAVKRGDMETARRMVDEAAKNAGYTISAYHGTPNADFNVFDKERVGKGNDQYGAGFYFATDKETATHYGGRVISAALDIKKPIRITVTSDSGANLIDANIELTSKQAYEVVKRLPGINDPEESILGDYYDQYWEVGPKAWMIRDLAEQYRDIGYLDSDLFRNYPNELHEALRDVVGYDGVEVTFESTGEKFYVAWFDNQMKSTDAVTYDDNGNVIPLSERFQHDTPDIRRSLSRDGEAPVRGDGYAVYGENVRVRDPAELDFAPLPPMQEDAAPVAAVAADTNAGDTSVDMGGFMPISAEEASQRDAGIAFPGDADAPPEREAPYYGEEAEQPAPDDPFEERDMKDVGNRSVKAYMYENPEVKPFFQAEANVMLGELERTTKGEKQFLYGDFDGYGAESYYRVVGTTRHTSDDIAYLRDELKYSYADIEKGLKAIIEDDGKENNAISKRIEFLLNDRLLNGYTDFETGYEYPPNQGYANLLNEKQITEYNEEARRRFFDNADAYVPPVEDIAPVATPAPAAYDIAPVREEYEAIRPQRAAEVSEDDIAPVMGERMVRVDSNNGRPGEKQRKWVGTSTGSDAVGGKILPDDLNQDTIHYQPISNKETLGKANARLGGMGYEASVAYFNSKFADKTVALDDIALGERLIQEAVKRGDTKTAGELIQNVALLGTELGQKVQALSIIKRLTPEGQLGLLKKTIERGKTKGDKTFEGVELTQDMIDKILAAYGKDGTYDQDKLNKAVEDVKQQIADQMKVTKLEKVNAWRYLAMLGNPKTHIRNVVSNVAMRGTLAVKNVVARTIESVAPIGNRTKTWSSTSAEVKAFAQKTALEMKDVLSDDGKYNEAASIKEKRQIFKNKVLNAVYEFNSDMLTKEDWWFSRPAFVNSLGEFLTANGIRTEADIQNNPEMVEKAKLYATEQSQIATFRQVSYLAYKISELENKNAGWNIAVGSILPFKKTPINIAKAGLSYSPLGFVKTLTYDASQVKNGKMEASELVDHLAQNLTGTALTLVGYLLASMGFLSGGGEDDKEGKYDYQLGGQAYSLNIGGKSYSLSWLSPVAMPLFVGANAYEQLVEGKEWNGDVVVETLAQTLDPLNEMSFLSGLTSVLSSYDSGMQKFAGIGETMIQNYATQFVPTAMSQVATVLDDTKRTTKVDGDSDNKFVDGLVNKLKYKIPGLRETLEPSTDIWGNEVKQTENVLARAFETFIAPYSKRDNIATEIDAEIKELYSQTGDGGVIPSIPDNYVNFGGEKYEMSGKEYTAFKNTYGQTAYNMLRELMNTGVYRSAGADERADMVNKVYDYARDEAKRILLAERGVTYTNASADGVKYYREDSIKGAIENNMTPEEYSYFRENPDKYNFLKANNVSYADYQSFDDDTKDAWTWAYNNPEGFTLARAAAADVVTYRRYASELNDIKADQSASGNSISGSRKAKVVEYINALDADYGEKLILFKSEYNADDTYNYEIVEYLNSRDDLSYEDVETILKKLGFTVSADGDISW